MDREDEEENETDEEENLNRKISVSMSITLDDSLCPKSHRDFNPKSLSFRVKCMM